MIAENQIRGSVARYLRGEISLDLFEDWFVERSWNMHRDSDEAAQKLASEIELRLAEHSSGHLDEPSLRLELLSLINKVDSFISFNDGLPAGNGFPNNNILDGGVIQFAGRVQQILHRPEGVEFSDTESATALG